MSKYTMELREIISTFGEDEVKGWFKQYELSDYLSEDEVKVVEERGTWNKDRLADRIVEHFFTREIGTDAIGQFMLFVKEKMHEVMETYAPIIYSAAIKYDPLNNIEIMETYSGTTDSDSSSTSKSTGSGLNVNSDTPQGQINKNVILQGRYASSTNANESESNVNGSASTKGAEEYSKTTKGHSGNLNQEMIKQYREIIRAINTEIVYQLEPLFMGIY